MVENLNSTSIRLSWEPQYDGLAPILGYQVEYHVIGNTASIDRIISSQPQNSAILSSLAPNTFYEIRLSLRNRLGFSRPIVIMESTRSKSQGKELSV